ncbi:MAG TPA: 1-acyl-sn-glycerol-3-phosphate acyltransferase [Phycisphaerae bacterium]|nr:1-acyl-sn-glycerol-3-phosphate acyltransferase [Phycisphaerae bacterium]
MNELRSHSNPQLRGFRLPGNIQQCTLYYRFMRRSCRIVTSLLWGQRVFNRHYEPATGGVVYVSNHQSFLDPILITNALCRPGNYMARETLFRKPWFRALIESVNTFPVRRGRADIGALKEAMRRLRDNRTVVVFPEGTRTYDGRIGAFLPGVALLCQRAAQWTVPVVIDGAFEAWPRTQLLPNLGRIFIRYGPGIHRDQARKHSPKEFVEHVRQELITMQTDLRRRLGRKELKYDE